jgi:hypothetical protein
LNLFHRQPPLRQQLPYDFIEKALENGCQYLSLAGSGIQHLTGKSEFPYKLKYLNMSMNMSQNMYKKKYQKLSQKVMKNSQGLPKMVQNCTSLQKLSVGTLPLDSDDIQYVCQNGQTLQVLDIGGCYIDACNLTKLLQNCAHLTELNIGAAYGKKDYSVTYIQALVDNLTPTVLKVALDDQDNLKDEHVKTLVKRCNNITHLDLSCTSITNDSVQSIIKHLKSSLENLDVTRTNVDFVTLFQFKTMPLLKTLIFFADENMEEDFENLEQQLSHIRLISITHIRLISINGDLGHLYIAKPVKRIFRVYYSFIDNDWIWEIRAKEQHVFKSVDNEILTLI